MLYLIDMQSQAGREFKFIFVYHDLLTKYIQLHPSKAKWAKEVTVVFFLLNTSKHNINEISIITFNGALLHVSAPGSHHRTKYSKPIANYWIACYIISALELDSYILVHIQ
jgi:hypothetical protein